MNAEKIALARLTEQQRIENEIRSAMNDTKYSIVGVIENIAVLSRRCAGEEVFTAAVRVNGKWERSGQAWGSYELAILTGLARLHGITSNQFEILVGRMLGIAAE